MSIFFNLQLSLFLYGLFSVNTRSTSPEVALGKRKESCIGLELIQGDWLPISRDSAILLKNYFTRLSHGNLLHPEFRVFEITWPADARVFSRPPQFSKGKALGTRLKYFEWIIIMIYWSHTMLSYFARIEQNQSKQLIAWNNNKS